MLEGPPSLIFPLCHAFRPLPNGFAFNHGAKLLTMAKSVLCSHFSDKSLEENMIESKRVQASVHREEPLREQLEASARLSVRSLSGEITFRLKRSLECDRQIDCDAA